MKIATFWTDMMSRREMTRNRNTRAQKLDTPATVALSPARVAVARPAGWKLLWVGSVAACRVGRFSQTLA